MMNSDRRKDTNVKRWSGRSGPKGFPAWVAAVAVILLMTATAFGAGYHVTVTGGSGVEDVATVDDEYVDSLTDIRNRNYDGSRTTFSGTGWNEGTVIDINTQSENAGVYKVISGASEEDLEMRYPNYLQIGSRKFDVVLKVDSCVADGKKATFAVRKDLINIQLGTSVKEVSLTNEEQLGSKEAGYQVFIYESGTTTPARIPDLRTGIIDLDLITYDNGAKSTEVVKVNDFAADEYNTWIKAGVQGKVRYNDGNFAGTGVSSSDANVFIKADQLSQTGSYSGYYAWILTSGTANTKGGMVIRFFTAGFPVHYTTDGHGSVDPEEEKRIAGENPTGSKQSPDEGYRFSHWTADRTVKLEDGTVIEEGKLLTEDQLRQVVLEEEMTFTAHFEPVWKITTEAVNGTITPTEEDIPAGENRVVTYTPDEGHQLVELVVDGEKKSIREHPVSYRFIDLDADHHVRAVFEPIPALEITKSADREIYNAGEKVKYTVTVKQTAEGARARNVVIRDTLPSGLVLVKDSFQGEGFQTVSAGDGGYELLIAELTDELTYTYEALTPKAADAEELINVVTAEADNVPGDPVRDEARVSAFAPKPVIEKTVSNEEPSPGDTVTYTISVKETEKDIALFHAVLTDPLPDGLELVEGSLTLTGDESEVEAADQEQIRIAIPRLDEETVVSFQAKITAKTGEIINEATLTGEDIEPLKATAKLKVKEEPAPQDAKATESDADKPAAGIKGKTIDDPTPSDPETAPSERPADGVDPVDPENPDQSDPHSEESREAKTGDPVPLATAAAVCLAALAALITMLAARRRQSK